MNLTLSSKAKTLKELENKISCANILPQISFYAMDYKNKKKEILSQISSFFSSEVIIRSSSSKEDNYNNSNAGNFESVANVSITNKDLDEAICKVINSYGNSLNNKDEIFVQKMLKEVSMCGVIFTSDLDTLSSYYIINYDQSGSTSSVTNGDGKDLQTFVCFKDYNNIKNIKLKKIIKASKECENIFNNNSLDIEFAFVEDKLYILQVRAIVKNNKKDLSYLDLNSSLNKLYKKIQKLNTKHPKLLGSKTIFGVMPDWNPAEIIGLKPKRLAISLYKELITNEIWAYQRDNYGYKNLRSFPLLVSFLGIPYIDIRISFNSFIPKNLHENIASKLIEHYLNELSKNCHYHDKIEFEIVFSCYYFGIDKKLKKLEEKDFTNSEIKQIEFTLLELTNNIIDDKNGLFKNDLKKIEQLKKEFINIQKSNLSLVDKIYWLIEDCKRYGTLPFAGIARAAFISVQFLNSFVEEKIITKEEKDKFLNSLNTVSKNLIKDKQNLSKKEFLKSYGHLRPGTYDITSKRYDEAYDYYFKDLNTLQDKTDFNFSQTHIEKIDKLIIENGLKTNANSLIKFIKDAIEAREYSKFIFTKSLSEVLLLVEEFGKKFHISREDLAFLDIKKVKELYVTLDHRDVADILNKDILKNKEFYKYTKAIKLPSLILNEDDIYSFYLEKEEANFVSLNKISSQVVNIEGTNKDYEGKIVCICSADPGYDYLFSKNIKGLITCYGGANSHMAIRCAELGIPAVIGCGENLFNKYKKANFLEIDALNKQVKIIS